MIAFAIECTYRPNIIPPETIALFESKLDADKYVSRHQGDGGGKLLIVKGEYEPLKYRIKVIYGQPRSSSVSYSIGISFAHECEASAYIYRHALWDRGYLVVSEQRLS
jgi:hypothetical protein